jgi:hypothetical protein
MQEFFAMRLISLGAVLAVASLPVFSLAQSQPPSQGQSPAASPMAACPVQISSASFARHATPLPVPDPNATTADKAYGTLEFRYRNGSGKPVRSFSVSARFSPPSGVQPPLLKTPEDVQHYLQGDPLAPNDASSARYEVRLNVNALLWLRLDKVVYQDGSSWAPSPSAPPDQCTYRPEAKLIPAHPVHTSAHSVN